MIHLNELLSDWKSSSIGCLGKTILCLVAALIPILTVAILYKWFPSAYDAVCEWVCCSFLLLPLLFLVGSQKTGSTITLEEYKRRELELRKKAEQGDLAAWTEWEEWTGRR